MHRPFDPRIILPGGFRNKSGLFVPSSFQTLSDDVAIPPELRPEAALFIVGEPPSFHDQILVYATEQELGLEPSSAEEIIALTREVKFWPSMRFLSRFQRDLWSVRLRQEGQLALLNRWFADTPFESSAKAWLRQDERNVLFSEQQLFALQRLILLNARDSDMDEPHTPAEYVALLAMLVAVPGSILGADVDFGETEPMSMADERWMRLFIGHGGFIGRGALRNELGRAHRLYGEIAQSPATEAHRDYCPIDDWLAEEYGLSFVELQAIAFALHAGSKMLDVDELPTLIDESYFASTLLSAKARRGLDALSAPRDWYVERFEATQGDPRRAAFEITPFLQRPALRQPDGKVMPFAPRSLEAWMSATGSYYRLFDIARATSSGTRKRFSRFNGYLVETYVLQTVKRAYPPRPTHSVLWLPGTVHDEQLYRTPAGERRTPDVAIDLTPDLILIEVTSSRLTERSLVDADPEAVRKDVQKVIVDKVEQLGSAIQDIRAGLAVFPGLEFAGVERIWPLIVSSEGLFQTPTLWAYIADVVEAALSQPAVQPLTLLDMEDTEELFGLVVGGESIVDVLRDKTREEWRERELAVLPRARRSGKDRRSPMSRVDLGAAIDAVALTLFGHAAVEDHRARLDEA